jgi:pilus assembly protein CpaC
MRRRPCGRAVVFGLLLAALALGGPQPAARAADPGLIRLDLIIGKSQVLDLQEPFSRVSVTSPAIADVFVITPNQILVSGKAVGVTSLVVFYPKKTLFFDLVVQSDIALLRDRLKQLAPRDDIDVQAAPDSIILTGSVGNTRTITAAAEIASAFAAKGRVVNLLNVTDAKPPQVMLQVHVAEVDRQAIHELGFAFRALGETFQGAVFPGLPFTLPAGSIGAALAGRSVAASSQSGPDFPFTGTNIFLSSGNRDYAGIVHALQERNLLRTLAKPNLVTQSGTDAKFLSGGEFPYPVSQSNTLNASITIEFKEFGIGLIFTPVVVDGEHINLKIRPEVSSLDFSQGLVSAGFQIPVIRKNEVFTNVTVKDGESFGIAGLINNDVRQAVAKIPVLGDIPIFGAIFRSTRFQNNETELVFLVTVKIVKPSPPGMGPDPTRLMELTDKEKKEFTLVPGIPGVGEVVDRPFGTPFGQRLMTPAK